MNQAHQAISVSGDDLKKPPLDSLTFVHVLNQGVGVAFDCGQWGPKLVGDVGYEIDPHLLRSLEIGDVMEYPDGPVKLFFSFSEGRNSKREEKLPLWEVEWDRFCGAGPPFGDHGSEGVLDLLFVEHLPEALLFVEVIFAEEHCEAAIVK